MGFGCVQQSQRQGMLAGGFGRGAVLQHIGLPHAGHRDHLCQRRLAARDGAGFIEQDCGQRCGALQCLAAAEEDAGFGAASAADHDGGRRRQAQRAGAGDNEHGDHIEDGCGQGGAANRQPADQRDDGQRDDGGHEDRGDAIGDCLNRRFARLRPLDQADDLRQDGVAADALRFDDQPSLLIDRAAENLGADGFIDRQALAGEHGFIYG